MVTPPLMDTQTLLEFAAVAVREHAVCLSYWRDAATKRRDDTIALRCQWEWDWHIAASDQLQAAAREVGRRPEPEQLHLPWHAETLPGASIPSLLLETG